MWGESYREYISHFMWSWWVTPCDPLALMQVGSRTELALQLLQALLIQPDPSARMGVWHEESWWNEQWVGLCGYAYGVDGREWLLGMWVLCNWKHCGGIVTSVSGEMDEQKMVFGNAGHFQTLIEIIYFFPPPYILQVQGTLLQLFLLSCCCRKMIDMNDIWTMIFS